MIYLLFISSMLYCHDVFDYKILYPRNDKEVEIEVSGSDWDYNRSDYRGYNC